MGIRVYDFDGTIVKENSPDILVFLLSKLCFRYKLAYVILYNPVVGYILGKLGIKNNRKLWYFFLALVKYRDYLKTSKLVAVSLTFNTVILDSYRNDSSNAWISSASFKDIIYNALKIDERVIANEMGSILGFAIPLSTRDNYSWHKVKRWKKANGNLQIEKFYTDSLSDLPLMNLATTYILIDND